MFCIKINSANKVIIAFIFIEYLFPYLMHFAVSQTSYMYFSDGLFPYLLFGFILSAALPVFIFNKKKLPTFNKKFTKTKYALLFLILCIVVFSLYYLNGLAGSRYFGRMSELPNFGLVKYVTQILFEIFAVCILLFLWGILLSKNLYWGFAKKISFLALFSITGINSAITLIYPICKVCLFSQHKQRFSKISFRYIKKYILIIFLLPVLFFGGLYIKSGQSGFFSSTSYFNKEYLIDRFSTHLYHLSSAIYLRSSNKSQEIEKIHEVYLASIADRFQLLISNRRTFKEDSEKSISGYFNFNYWNRELGSPAPGGSSIGLFATMVLIFPLQIVFFVNSLFFMLIKKCLVKVFNNHPNCSWLMAFSFAYGPLRIFTDDPLLLLNPLEPFLPCFLIFYFFYRKAFIIN